MKYVKIVANEDGVSYFVDQALELPGKKPSVLLTICQQGDWVLSQGAPGNFSDYHTTRAPRLLIVLQGCLEIGVSAEDVRQFHPGDIVYACDTTGRGHTAARVGNDVCRILSAVWDPSVA
jgi:hypothetical protein